MRIDCYITTPCRGQLPRPLLTGLTNCSIFAHYSPSSVRPDSTFPNFSGQQCPQQQGETLKSDYHSQVTWDLGWNDFPKGIGKIALLMYSPGLGVSRPYIFLQMCAGAVDEA